MRPTNIDDDEMKATINRAIRLNRSDRHREAIALLLPLSRSHPHDGAVQGLLAGAYFELDDLVRAARYFRAATVASPKSELASLGLFHSLWGRRMKAKALAEMGRFLSLRDSDEYTTLLHDLAVERRLSVRREPAGSV